jgi:UDP-N-acetyl-D-mannosaminuronate dehydrogenase
VGHSVTGLDIRQATIDSLNAGRSHIDDLADEDVAAMVAVGLRATTSVADIARHDVAQPPPPGLLDELAQGADPARVPSRTTYLQP